MKKCNLRVLYALICLWSITSLFNDQVSAQPPGTTNFYSNIKSYNLATLWHADKLKLLNLKRQEPFPEPYGIIGKNNQRFYIHYTAVNKNPSNPYSYSVQGKTRVGTQIHQFTGTITVKEAGIFKPGNNAYAPDPYKGFKRGKLVCLVVINEAGNGTITGELTTDFCINAQNLLFYDTLDFGIDGYGNNHMTGKFKADNSKVEQKVEYGDYSLTNPDFSDESGIIVPAQYEKYGWQSFVHAQSSDGTPASKAAIAEEKRQWWK